MATRKVDKLFQDYESTHIVEELGSWLKLTADERKSNIHPPNEAFFKFALYQTTPKPGNPKEETVHNAYLTKSLVVIHQDSIAKKTLYSALMHSFCHRTAMGGEPVRFPVSAEDGRVVTGSVKSRFAALPDTLFITINRLRVNPDGPDTIDTSPLAIARILDFGAVGFEDLVTGSCKPKRYELVGAIIGKSVTEPVDNTLVDDFKYQTYALMRGPDREWYIVTNPENMPYYMTRGKECSEEQLYAMLGVTPGTTRNGMPCERPVDGKFAPYFAMRLFYRSYTKLLPLPHFRAERKWASQFLPSAFDDLFDSSLEERRAATMDRANYIREAVRIAEGLKEPEDLERDVTVEEVIKFAPDIDGLADIEYGTGHATPEAMLAIMDTGNTMIGRTAYQMFRVRMLLGICAAVGLGKAGTEEERKKDARVIVNAVKFEWARELDAKKKIRWIAVADYFNRIRLIGPPANRNKLLRTGAPVYDDEPPMRMTARSLFLEQWPVLVGKKMEIDKLTPEERKTYKPKVSFLIDKHGEDFLKQPKTGGTNTNEDMVAITRVRKDTLLMDQIWDEMRPESREIFSGLAKARNELGLATNQGMCETWETMPFQVDDDDEGYDPSVFRMDIVRGEMTDSDMRTVKLKELESSGRVGTSIFINGHVMCAMQQEILNPYLDYELPNFKMEYSDKTCLGPGSSGKMQGSTHTNAKVETTAITIDPVADANLGGALRMLRSHAVYGRDGVLLAIQKARFKTLPDTFTLRTTPWPVRRDASVDPVKDIDSIAMGAEFRMERCAQGLVPIAIDHALVAKDFSDDGEDVCPPGVEYRLVGLLYIKRKALKYGGPDRHLGQDRALLKTSKVPMQTWNEMTDEDRPRTFMTDEQRQEAYTLVFGWNCQDSQSRTPPISVEELDGMLRTCMGILRLSTGYVLDPGVGDGDAEPLKRDFETTMVGLNGLPDLGIVAQQFESMLRIVMQRSPKPNSKLQQCIDATLKKLELNNLQPPWPHDQCASATQCAEVLIKHMGRGGVWKDAFPDAEGPSEADPASKVGSPKSKHVPHPEQVQTWFLHRVMDYKEAWIYSDCFHDDPPEDPDIAIGRTKTHKDPPSTLMVGTDDDGYEWTVIAYYRHDANFRKETECCVDLCEDQVSHAAVDQITSEIGLDTSLRLMAWSPFVRDMLFHYSTTTMKHDTSYKILTVFMCALCGGKSYRAQTAAALRLIEDHTLRHETFLSFMTRRAFGKRGLAAYYGEEKAKPKKKRPESTSGGWNGDDDADGSQSSPAPELTEEEREQLAIEHAKELKRKWMAEAEARARSAAIEAERVERERRAAEEAAAAAEALREQQKVAEAERAARAVEEAKVLREAREEKAARDKAVADARAAAEKQKAKDEAAAKAAKAATAKEERKAKRDANKERKHAPLDVKTQVTRDAAQRKQKQTSEQKAAELAAKMAAEKEAKEAAEKERARIETARADAAAAAKAAAVKQHKAHKKAERAAALEAEGIADEAELAEAWLSSQSSQPSRSSDPVPPLSPASTSTATSSRVLYDYDNECIVCLSAPQTHLCTHCFNLAVCGACAQTLTSCPVCREETVFRMVHRP